MSTEKRQSESDQTSKRVNEGVQTFETNFDKIQSMNAMSREIEDEVGQHSAGTVREARLKILPAMTKVIPGENPNDIQHHKDTNSAARIRTKTRVDRRDQEGQDGNEGNGTNNSDDDVYHTDTGELDDQDGIDDDAFHDAPSSPAVADDNVMWMEGQEDELESSDEEMAMGEKQSLKQALHDAKRAYDQIQDAAEADSSNKRQRGSSQGSVKHEPESPSQRSPRGGKKDIMALDEMHGQWGTPAPVDDDIYITGFTQHSGEASSSYRAPLPRYFTNRARSSSVEQHTQISYSIPSSFFSSADANSQRLDPSPSSAAAAATETTHDTLRLPYGLPNTVNLGPASPFDYNDNDDDDNIVDDDGSSDYYVTDERDLIIGDDEDEDEDDDRNKGDDESIDDEGSKGLGKNDGSSNEPETNDDSDNNNNRSDDEGIDEKNQHSTNLATRKRTLERRDIVAGGSTRGRTPRPPFDISTAQHLQPESNGDDQQPPVSAAQPRKHRPRPHREMPFTQSAEQAAVPSQPVNPKGHEKLRKLNDYWTDEEVAALDDGLRMYGKRWMHIKNAYAEVLVNRTNVQLKDKARNIARQRRKNKQPLEHYGDCA